MRSEVEVTRGEIAHKVLAFVSATTNITSEPSRAEIFWMENREDAPRCGSSCRCVRTN